MSSLCNVNGKIVPEEDARISVLDRGFLFGDSIYEVIRTRSGVPFAWPEHLQRLHASAAGLQMELDLTDREITHRIVETVRAAGNVESYIRVIVTRGENSAPNIDVEYAIGGRTCVVMVRLLPEDVGHTAHVAIVRRLRTDRRALDPAIKSGNYLNNVMGLKEARSRGATECLFMNSDGRLTEASTSNVWIIDGDTVATPALSAGLLPGVTRRILMAMCEKHGIRCVERDVHEADIRSADGIFLTSTLRGICLVDRLDGTPMETCDMFRDLVDRFENHCDELVEKVYRPGIEAMLR